ncbi:hypothetical protein IWQ62_003087 [Dispira parvispora]|uniref:Peptidase S8/S53 domain-containing protein n=1 Tax=Dispira parvispora TaxID=1520584 RepID=A0A9W8AQ16_9FUNG|nr:hypothetical protein IWQ62_003087 [Dispira parvispora]
MVSKWVGLASLVAVLGTLTRFPPYVVGQTTLNDAWDTTKGLINLLPNSFIIHFDGDPGTDEGQKNAADFFTQLRSLGISYTIGFNYTAIMNAASIKVEDKYVDTMASLSMAQNVWSEYLSSGEKMDNTGVRALPALAPLEHEITGVKKVHGTLKYTGKGVKVGILDSGLDYTHPAFGGCFKTSGCRVQYGYDFVGDSYTGSNAPVPDNDPMDQCNGHGTHVAGTLAGNDGNFRGVAPDATLGIYRVLGCNGLTTSALILQGLELAFKDGMQVINLSLGISGGWGGWDAWAEAGMANIMTQKGVVIVGAAGNDGDSGMFGMSSPAVALGVVAVTAMEMPKFYSLYFNLTLEENVPIRRSDHQAYLPQLSILDKQLRPATNANGDDFGCGSVVDLTGTVGLVKRGSCSFTTKALNLIKAGAIGMVVYNDVAGEPGVLSFDQEISIPAFSITQADGKYVLDEIAKRGEVRVRIKNDLLPFNNTKPYNTPGFTSMGPSPEGQGKPDISAPGVNIYSCLPKKMGSYGTASGSSMASPYVAGVAALLIQAGKTTSTEQFYSALIHTATPQMTGDSYISVAQQGAGLVNAYGAVISDVVFSKRFLLGEFWDNAELYGTSNSHTFRETFSNTGAVSAYYTSSFSFAQSITSFDSNKQLTATPIVGNVRPKVTIWSTSVVTVHPGMSRAININLDHNGLVNGTFFIYSGYVLLTPRSNYKGSAMAIPLAGMAYQSFDAPILPPVSTGLPCLVRYSEGRCLSGTNAFTFKGGDFPTVVFRIQLPLFRLRIRIAKAATPNKIHASVVENHYFKLAKNMPHHKVTYYTYRWDGNVFHSDNPSKIFPISRGEDYVLMMMFYVTNNWNPFIYTTPPITATRV